ncbi:MAG: OmpA family protein [Deltaproteobacteria bacterium]|jgi:outer membrane protein OmpA-like peptidoglycan-associated protein|nr:OmpA family protein [Deltaproteobacteria bacterium]
MPYPSFRHKRPPGWLAFILTLGLALAMATALATKTEAMTNHHDYFPYGWVKPALYGALRVNDQMIDFDISVEGEETRREEFILPDNLGRVLRLSHNGRVFCYVADHDLADPWDYQVVDYDGSGAFESKEPPFSDFPLPRWTFINYPFRYINNRRLTDLTGEKSPSVRQMIDALTGGGPRRPAYTPEQIAALTIARGGTPPPEKYLPEPTERPRLALNILFEFDKDVLTPEAQATLDTLGKAITSQELANSTFRLEGHTDAKGSYDYNIDLSQRRSRSVQRYLMEHFNLPSRRLPTDGLGESRHLPNIDPEDGRNRRVEIINLGSGQYVTGDYSSVTKP